jgi:hypothetical protein
LQKCRKLLATAKVRLRNRSAETSSRRARSPTLARKCLAHGQTSTTVGAHSNLSSRMKQTFSAGWNWFWKLSAGVYGKRIANETLKAPRHSNARPATTPRKISRGASSADIAAGKNPQKSKSRISGRKPVRSRWRDVRPWGQSRIRCSCGPRPNFCGPRSKPKSGIGTGCDPRIPPARRIDNRREFPR